MLDLTPAARRALKGQAGQQGPQGPKGDAGPPGLGGVEIVQASSAFVTSPEQTVIVETEESWFVQVRAVCAATT